MVSVPAAKPSDAVALTVRFQLPYYPTPMVTCLTVPIVVPPVVNVTGPVSVPAVVPVIVAVRCHAASHRERCRAGGDGGGGSAVPWAETVTVTLELVELV